MLKFIKRTLGITMALLLVASFAHGATKVTNFPNGFPNGVTLHNVPILNVHGGDVFWVDSGAGSNGYKGTFSAPFSTIEYAQSQCTANNGDIVIAKPGHVETVTAAAGLDLDVAGVTIVFMGQGDNQAYVTFTTAVSADMDVDADDITLIRPKFVAGIDALTGPIDVNSADFAIYDGEYHDATDIETTDCIIATSAATRLKIDGWKYFKSNEGGTQKESHIQIDGVDDMVLRNIHVEGDFDVGIVETGTDEWLRVTLENMFLKNTDPGNAPCLEMDSACSGWANNVHCRNANGTAVSDAADLNWSASCLQYGTDGYSGSQIGTGAGGGAAYADCVAAIEADNLDHILQLDGATQVYPENCVDDSILAKILSKSDPADVSDYDNSTDSLEAIADALAAGTGCTAAIDADNLDHLASTDTGVAADDSLAALIVDGSILAHIMDSGAAVADWDASTDSLQAIADALAAGTGCTAAIDADNLDHLASTDSGVAADGDLTTLLADGSFLSHIMTAGADTSDYKASTDSLEAIANAVSTIDSYVDRGTDGVLGQTYAVSVEADEVTQDLWDVAGGDILITSMVGKVDVQIGANATNCKLLIDRDDGAADTEFTTAVAIETDAVGTVYIFTAANPAVLTPLTPGANGSSSLMTGGWYCPEGMIEQNMDADPGGAAGDHITWFMTYIPLETGVTVTAQ